MSSVRHRVPRAAWLLAAFLLLFQPGCGSPAQIGTHEDCYAALDALWTAVTAKRVDLLDQCAAKLQRLHTEGKLPEAAWKDLEEIIDQAREEDWEPATADLKALIRAQAPPGR